MVDGAEVEFAEHVEFRLVEQLLLVLRLEGCAALCRGGLLLLALLEVQPVLAGKLLADAFAAVAVVPVTDSPAVIVDTVEGYMHVRMLLVVMPSDDILRIADAHFHHVFPAYPHHQLIG